MMTAMLTQLPLPWLPEGATEIAPGVGLAAGPGGGVVWVHGMATFAWDTGDEAGRRLAAVLLCSPRLKATTGSPGSAMPMSGAASGPPAPAVKILASCSARGPPGRLPGQAHAASDDRSVFYDGHS